MSDKYVAERQTLVNKETGKEINGLVKVVECDRNNFDILYLMAFGDIFDVIGGKKYQVVKYLMQHRDAENQVIITIRELSEETGVSTKTVTNTLSALKKCGAITTRTGVIRFNPKVIVHGSKKKEDWIFTKFIQEQKKNIAESEQKKTNKSQLDLIPSNKSELEIEA